MLLRCAAAALLAMTACVTVEDEPVDDLPLHVPAAEADAPALDALEDQIPTTVTETPVNQRPWPGADDITTLEDGQVKVRIEQLLANDVDPEGGRVIFTGLGVVDGGEAHVDAGYVVFTPEPDFVGVGFYDYVISDGRLQATGRVKVHVLAVNDAPVAYPDEIRTVTGVPVTFLVAAVDIDGDALSLEILDAPAHGSLTADAEKLQYSPEPGWTGTDRLVYRVTDGAAWSEPTTIDLSVTPAN